MAGFNGSGTYVRQYSWVAIVTEDDTSVVDATEMDEEMDGFAAGISQCITHNGETTVTNDIPFNGHNLKGVKDPVDDQDAATKAWVQGNSLVNGGEQTFSGQKTFSSNPTISGTSAGINFIDTDDLSRARALFSNGNFRVQHDANDDGTYEVTSVTFTTTEISTELPIYTRDDIAVQDVNVASVDVDPAVNETSGVFLDKNGLVSVYRTSNVALKAGRNDDGTLCQFNRNGAIIGNISITAAAVSFNTTSDRRAKYAIADLPCSGEFIDGLKPRLFRWQESDKLDAGFIADELAEVCPEAVQGEPGGAELQSVNYASAQIIANLVAEVQLLRRRVEALEAK